MIPSNEWIQEQQLKIKEELGFDGVVKIEVLPYLFFDFRYEVKQDLSEIKLTVYSARFPQTWHSNINRFMALAPRIIQELEEKMAVPGVNEK